MLSTGLGGSYVVAHAVAARLDGIEENVPKVRVENVSVPFAPPKPPEPRSAPPPEAAYRERERLAVKRLNKKARAPWLDAVVKSLVLEAETEEQKYESDQRTHATASGPAVVGVGVLSALAQKHHQGGSESESEESDDSPPPNEEEKRARAPGPGKRASAIFGLDDDLDKLAGGDEGERGGDEKAPYDGQRTQQKPHEQRGGTGAGDSLFELTDMGLAVAATSASSFVYQKKKEKTSKEGHRKQNEAEFIARMCEIEQPLNSSNMPSSSSAVPRSTNAQEGEGGSTGVSGGEGGGGGGGGGGGTGRDGGKSGGVGGATIAKSMRATFNSLFGLGGPSALLDSNYGDQSRSSSKKKSRRASATQTERFEATRRRLQDEEESGKCAMALVVEEEARAGNVLLNGGRHDHGRPFQSTPAASAASPSSSSSSSAAAAALVGAGVVLVRKEEFERHRLARLARLGAVAPCLGELEDSSSESSGEEEAFPYQVGMRVEVKKKTRPGKAWVKGTVHSVPAEVAALETEGAEERAKELARKAFWEASREAAEDAAKAAELAASLFSSFSSSSSSSAFSPSPSLPSSSKQTPATLAERRAAYQARKDNRACRRELKLSDKRRRRKLRAVRPVVLLDGWKVPMAFEEVRPLTAAETSLLPGESEAVVAKWVTSLEVVALPTFAFGGEPSGFTLHGGEKVVYLRKEAVRHTPPGHGGRHFDSMFYEISNGSGGAVISFVAMFPSVGEFPDARAIDEISHDDPPLTSARGLGSAVSEFLRGVVGASPAAAAPIAGKEQPWGNLTNKTKINNNKNARGNATESGEPGSEDESGSDGSEGAASKSRSKHGSANNDNGAEEPGSIFAPGPAGLAERALTFDAESIEQAKRACRVTRKGRRRRLRDHGGGDGKGGNESSQSDGSDGSGSEAEKGQEGSDGSGDDDDDDDEQQGTKKKKLKKKANKKEKKAKKEKLLSPLYLERLAAVKAKYGMDLYGELVWWEDQGTLEGERTQAKLDGIAELEVKARVAVANWKAEVAKGGGGGGGGAGDREAGGASLSSSPRAASSLWFGGGTSKEIQATYALAAQKAKQELLEAGGRDPDQDGEADGEGSRKQVRFDEVLRMLFIPSWRVLRPSVRESTWLSTQELAAAKKRSVVEFEFEEFEFEKVLEDEHFTVHGGEKVHPVHLFAERLLQQSVGEVKLLSDEAHELSQLRRLIKELILDPVQPLDGSYGGGASASASADEPSVEGGTSVNAQSPSVKKNLTEMPLAFWRGRYASRRDFGLTQADPYDRGRAVDKRRKQLEVQKQAAQKTLRDLSSGGKGGEKAPLKKGGGGENENGEDDGIEGNGEGGEDNYEKYDDASDEKEEEEDGQRHHDSDDDANENDDLFGEGDDSLGFAAKRESGGGGFGVGVGGGLQKWGKVQGGVGTVKKRSTRARDAAKFGTSSSTSSLKEKKKNRRRNKRGGRGGVGSDDGDEEGEGGEEDDDNEGGGDAAWLMALNGDISGEFNRLEALEAVEAKRKQVRTSKALEAVATFERVGRKEAAQVNLPNQPVTLRLPKQGQEEEEEEEEEAKLQGRTPPRFPHTPPHSSALPVGLGGDGVGGRGSFFPPSATALTKQGLDLVLLNARDPGSTAKASKLIKSAARLRRKHEKERGRNAKELEELRRIVALLDTR